MNLILYFVNENGHEVLLLCSQYFYCKKYCEQYCHVPQFMTCLTNSYFKACSYSASSEIPHVLWIPKVHCHVLSSLLLVPVPSQMSAVLTLTSCFFKILFNNFFPSIPRSVQVFFSIHATCLAHFILLDAITIFDLQTEKLFVKHPLHSVMLIVFCSENLK